MQAADVQLTSAFITIPIMAGSEEKHAARVALNIIFREVVLCTQRNTEHAKEFSQSVRVESVEDYLAFVDPGDATVCIEQILSRTRSCFYTSISQFRGDFERILANAMVSEYKKLRR